jgi:hypothetical protein
MSKQNGFVDQQDECFDENNKGKAGLGNEQSNRRKTGLDDQPKNSFHGVMSGRHE